MNSINSYLPIMPVKQVNQAAQTEKNNIEKITDNGEKTASKGNTKKIAFALAGMAAVGVAGVLLHKKLNASKIIKEAGGIKEQAAEAIKKSDGIEKEAETVFSDAKKLADDAISKIKETLKLSPEKIKDENGQKVFEEIQDGVLKNKSFFNLEDNNVILNTIEKYKENGIKDVVKLENNCVESVLNNVKESADGTLEAATRFFFEDGKLSMFNKNYKELADGTKMYAKAFEYNAGIFGDGKLNGFIEDAIESADGTGEIAKAFNFEDGKLNSFVGGTKALSDGTGEIAKIFNFEDGNFKKYAKGTKLLSDGTKKTAKIFDFEDGKLIDVTKDFNK